MDVAWLAAFCQVARLGSFTAAGRVLGYTQSTISRQISELEKAYDVTLFDRLARGVRLTEQGHRLLGHAEAVLDRLNTAERDLDSARGLAAGRLRVGAFDTANVALVPRALAAFRAAYPQVALSLVEGVTQRQLTHLRDGEVDVAVVSAYPHQELDGATFDLRFLCDDPLLVALPRTHRFARRRTLRLAELASETWVEGFPAGAEALVHGARHAGFQPPIEFTPREWIAKQGFVAAGLGITLVPALAATSVRPDLMLVALHADDAPMRTIYAATVRRQQPSAAVSAFLGHLADSAADGTVHTGTVRVQSGAP
jgi:DNA-binding transcriptional LysR family regulator